MKPLNRFLTAIILQISLLLSFPSFANEQTQTTQQEVSLSEFDEGAIQELVQVYVASGSQLCIDENGRWKNADVEIPQSTIDELEESSGEKLAEEEKVVSCSDLLAFEVAARKKLDEDAAGNIEEFYSCATQGWDVMDKLSLARDMDLVLDEVFTCNSENESGLECIKGLACNSFRSVGLGASQLLMNAMDIDFCAPEEPSCISQVLDGLLKNLASTAEFLWDGVKAGASWVGGKISDWWNDVEEVEDATSDKLHLLSSADEDFLDKYKRIKEEEGGHGAALYKIFSNLMSGIGKFVDEGIKDNFGCAKYETDSNGEEKCVDPVISWGCATCSQKANMMCGVMGVIGGEVLINLLTGGALAVTKAGATAIMSGIKTVGRTVGRSRLFSPLTNTLRIAGAKGASIISTAQGFAVKIGNRIVNLPPDKLVDAFNAARQSRAGRIASGTGKLMMAPIRGYAWAMDKLTALSMRGVASLSDNVARSMGGRFGRSLERISGGRAKSSLESFSSRVAQRADEIDPKLSLSSNNRASSNGASADESTNVSSRSDDINSSTTAQSSSARTRHYQPNGRNEFAQRMSPASNTRKKNVQLFLKNGDNVQLKQLRYTEDGTSIVVSKSKNPDVYGQLVKNGQGQAIEDGTIVLKIGDDVERAIVNYNKSSGSKVARHEEAFEFSTPRSEVVEMMQSRHRFTRNPIRSNKVLNDRLSTFHKLAPTDRAAIYANIDNKIRNGVRLNDFEVSAVLYRGDVIRPKLLGSTGKPLSRSTDEQFAKALDIIETRDYSKVGMADIMGGVSERAKKGQAAVRSITANERHTKAAQELAESSSGARVADDIADASGDGVRVADEVGSNTGKLTLSAKTKEAIRNGAKVAVDIATAPISPQNFIRLGVRGLQAIFSSDDASDNEEEQEVVVEEDPQEDPSPPANPPENSDDSNEFDIEIVPNDNKIKISYSDKVDSCRLQKLIPENAVDIDGNEVESEIVLIGTVDNGVEREIQKEPYNFTVDVECKKADGEEYKFADTSNLPDLKIFGEAKIRIFKCSGEECDSASSVNAPSSFRPRINPAPLRQFTPPQGEPSGAPVLNTL